ncbi:MAG TPA: hypothetical protein VMD03_02960 [Steroidobacteraceae bacterium]|nr:hypothetical protein [Steroidobacteraceae bacterium]
MWRSSAIRLALTLGLAAAGISGARALDSAAASCDRECLERTVDRFLDALVSHNPSALAWARGAMYTENNVALQIGDGLWATASKKGDRHQALVFADVPQGEVAYFGVIEERGSLDYLALRLKVDAGRIAEAELIANRKSETGPRGDPTKLVHDPAFSRPVPPGERVARARMIDLAYGYFSTLQLNDGKIFTQFAPDCGRLENGMPSAGDPHASNPYSRLHCEEQFKLGNYRWDDRLRDRRFPLVDEERGLVLASGFIDHSGVLDQYVLTDGTVKTSPIRAPHAWHFLEVFKIERGRISRIESVFVFVPYGMPSPWTERTREPAREGPR